MRQHADNFDMKNNEHNNKVQGHWNQYNNHIENKSKQIEDKFNYKDRSINHQKAKVKQINELKARNK